MNNRRFSSKGAVSSGTIIESNGPQGKIKGNLQQLIERYMSLGKDAFREGDTIISEKCFQHAEHFRRMLGEVSKSIRRKPEESVSLRTAEEEQQEAISETEENPEPSSAPIEKPMTTKSSTRTRSTGGRTSGRTKEKPKTTPAE